MDRAGWSQFSAGTIWFPSVVSVSVYFYRWSAWCWPWRALRWQVPLEEGLNKTIQYFSRELEHQANNQYIPKPKAARMKKGRPRHNWVSITDCPETKTDTKDASEDT